MRNFRRIPEQSWAERSVVKLNVSPLLPPSRQVYPAVKPPTLPVSPSVLRGRWDQSVYWQWPAESRVRAGKPKTGANQLGGEGTPQLNAVGRADPLSPGCCWAGAEPLCPMSMPHHLPSALPSSPGNGFSLRERSLQPPVPSSSQRCLTLRQPAADTGVLLLWAHTDPLPRRVHGHVPAPVACSLLELHPTGLPHRGVLSPEAAGSWLLPTAGKSHIQPRRWCLHFLGQSFMGPQQQESPQCLLRWICG